jgi:hypothetical protein
MKFALSRVRLNSQGYDSYGSYWGHGAPLWRVECDACDVFRHIRACDRDAAKALVRKLYPDATFYR